MTTTTKRTIEVQQGSVERGSDMLVGLTIRIQGDRLEDVREFFNKNKGKTASLSISGEKAIKFKIIK